MKKISLFEGAVWVTGIYGALVVAATVMNLLGIERWLFGIAAGESNAVGDTLAGTFAPLAFLWFFVSTWLQRTELEETRRVLADQGEQMQKSAQESAEQTRILQARELYEEHSQILYYLAAYIMRELINVSVNTSGGQTVSIIQITNQKFELQETKSSVDAVISALLDSLNKAYETVELAGGVHKNTPEDRVNRFRNELDYINGQLLDLTGSPYYENPLVRARLKGTNLMMIAVKAGQLMRAVERST